MRFSVVIWGELICSHYQNDGSSETIDADYYFYFDYFLSKKFKCSTFFRFFSLC